MTWQRPELTEIKMDAEFTAYCDDLEMEPVERTVTSDPECESGS